MTNMKAILLMIFVFTFSSSLEASEELSSSLLEADEARPTGKHTLTEVDGILREYVDRGVLTKEEEKTVIELAKKRGIEKVSKISTFYIRPSSARGISVHGVEQVKGREILNSILTVNRKGWTHAGRVPGKADIQFGDFWAGKASIRKTTILMVDKKEYRISSPHGLTTEQCDSMLKKLQDGKFTLAPNAQKERLKGIDWKKPTSFNKFGDNISASFSAKGRESGWYTLNISLDGEKLLISEIMLAMP